MGDDLKELARASLGLYGAMRNKSHGDRTRWAFLTTGCRSAAVSLAACAAVLLLTPLFGIIEAWRPQIARRLSPVPVRMSPNN